MATLASEPTLRAARGLELSFTAISSQTDSFVQMGMLSRCRQQAGRLWSPIVRKLSPAELADYRKRKPVIEPNPAYRIAMKRTLENFEAWLDRATRCWLEGGSRDLLSPEKDSAIGVWVERCPGPLMCLQGSVETCVIFDDHAKVIENFCRACEEWMLLLRSELRRRSASNTPPPSWWTSDLPMLYAGIIAPPGLAPEQIPPEHLNPAAHAAREPMPNASESPELKRQVRGPASMAQDPVGPIAGESLAKGETDRAVGAITRNAKPTHIIVTMAPGVEHSEKNVQRMRSTSAYLECGGDVKAAIQKLARDGFKVGRSTLYDHIAWRDEAEPGWRDRIPDSGRSGNLEWDELTRKPKKRRGK